MRDGADVIDTSIIRPAQLQSYVKLLISAPQSALTLVFESFAFKRGVPLDADYVFDVRMLPNPHYVPALRALTGRDAPVIEWLREHEDVARMYGDIEQFLQRWLDALARDHRSYVTVAIGCTGGQHRSVFLVEQLRTGAGSPRPFHSAPANQPPDCASGRTPRLSTATGCRCRSLCVSTCTNAGSSRAPARSRAPRISSSASRLSNTGRL